MYGFHCHVEINPQTESLSIVAFAQLCLSVAILHPILVALALMALIQKNGISEIKCPAPLNSVRHKHISLIYIIIWMWATDTKPRTDPDSI